MVVRWVRVGVVGVGIVVLVLVSVGVARHEERIKLEFFRVVAHPRHEHGPLHRRVGQLRVRQVGHVAEHHAHRIVACAHGVGHALEPSAQMAVDRQHDRHAEGRLVVEGGGRARKQQVQVVLGAMEEDVPQVMRRRVLGHLDGHSWKHPQVQRNLADVLALLRTRHVHVARDARIAHSRRLELALAGAKGAHAAHGAFAAGQQVARLAVVAGGRVVVVVVVVGHGGARLCARARPECTNAADD